jgi:hypothetical protein
MPPSLPTSPHRTANPASVSPPHRAQESTFLWRESDPWKQQNTEGAAKLSDVIQIANYMQDILSDRNRLALDQSAKIQELELVRVQYAEEIGCLKGMVSKLEDRMRSHSTDLSAEIEAILKEVSAPGFAEHQQRNSDGKPNSPARFTHTRTHARTHTRRLDANL